MSDNDNSNYSELTAYFVQRGLNPEQIAKILEEVKDYDQRTMTDSIFDSLEAGSLDLEGIIQKVLGDEGQKPN